MQCLTVRKLRNVCQVQVSRFESPGLAKEFFCGALDWQRPAVQAKWQHSELQLPGHMIFDRR